MIPVVKTEICTGCGLCEIACPVEAIDVDVIASIDTSLCVKCGSCTVACVNYAIAFEETDQAQLAKY